jgi:3-oxoacyl-[acyl-carrier-protein] synthase I
MPALITAAGVLCPVGRGPAQLWASVRAGISRITAVPIRDRYLQPMHVGVVPEEALEPALPADIAALPLPPRAHRMLRIGVPALRAVLAAAGDGPVQLYLGLPHLSIAENPWIRGFALYLCRAAGAEIDSANSRVMATGRAAALETLALALEALERAPMQPIIVGGVDSLFDRELLEALDLEGRILGPANSDGFNAGEGAAFVVLAHPSCVAPESAAALATVIAAASVADPAPRAGAEPSRGEGLASALELLRARLPGGCPPVAITFAGLNGESYDAKQWGVARLRHRDLFAASSQLIHPVDCFGDPGAALGSILLCLAATALASGDRAGPALAWVNSDGPSRACALLSAHATRA